MRVFRTRMEDATFELNLAPMLDIIVSIVPTLLISVVFVHIMIVDTPVPQAVQRAMATAEKKEETSITLAASKTQGFKIDITSNGSTQTKMIPLKGNDLDLDALHSEMLALKQKLPNIFKIELHPEDSIDLNQIVGIMDKVRNRSKQDPKIFFNDVDTGKQVETELIFPDVVFGNVAGG